MKQIQVSNGLLRAIRHNNVNAFDLLVMSEDDILSLPRFRHKHLVEIAEIRELVRTSENVELSVDEGN